MTQIAPVRLGRPAAASKEEALGLATDHYLDGRRVDVQAIARELGLARATMYRWFGTREVLVGEVIATRGEEQLALIRKGVGGNGAGALLETLYLGSRGTAASKGLRALLAQEQERGLRILTSSDGVVQPRIVAAYERLIDLEVQGGHFASPLDSGTLAYAVVRLGEAFIYNDAAVGIRGDVARLREVYAALLGIV
jgi:AcrR family transcriptional regulator